MKLIVGLGNPGEKYKNNRHNVGYMVVDYLEKVGLPEGVVAKKPDTFMNDSGNDVAKLMSKLKAQMSNLYVIHDDLDIPLGKYKIQFGKGPKVHNGVSSVEEVLGATDFWRARIGVDNRDPENRISGEVYTLQDFTEEEKKVLGRLIKQISADLILKIS